MEKTKRRRKEREIEEEIRGERVEKERKEKTKEEKNNRSKEDSRGVGDLGQGRNRKIRRKSKKASIRKVLQVDSCF